MSGAYRYCPRCGAGLSALAEGRDAGRPACSACGFVHYENPAVTTFGVIERDGLFLVLRRAHEPYAGLWDMAGGFVEPGEEPEHALLREIAEETHLEVALDGLLGVSTSRYGPGRHTVDVAFACRVTGGKLAISDEKSEARWVAPGELPPMAFDAQTTALRTYLETRQTTA